MFIGKKGKEKGKTNKKGYVNKEAATIKSKAAVY